MTRIPTSMLLLGGLTGLMAAGAADAVTTAREVPDIAADVPEVVVHFNSDTLATDSGTRALYRRLESAAEWVCPSDTRLVYVQVQKCRQAAVTDAVNQIHDERLAALHAAATAKAS
jgi:UrcA family protein